MPDWTIFGFGLWLGYIYGFNRGQSELKTDTVYRYLTEFTKKVLEGRTQE